MQIKPILFRQNSGYSCELNNLYSFYRETWAKTFNELGSKASDIDSDFHKMNLKLGFFIDQTVPIAFHGYRFFNLNEREAEKDEYFSRLDIPLIRDLKSHGVKRLATLEYMCVSPDYRKIADNNVGLLLGGFSTQFFKTTSFDATITITRNNRSVNKMCRMYGATPLYENLKMHNTEVDVMLFKYENVSKHPDLSVQYEIDYLLKNVSTSDEIDMQEAA